MKYSLAPYASLTFNSVKCVIPRHAAQAVEAHASSSSTIGNLYKYNNTEDDYQYCGVNIEAPPALATRIKDGKDYVLFPEFINAYRLIKNPLLCSKTIE